MQKLNYFRPGRRGFVSEKLTGFTHIARKVIGTKSLAMYSLCHLLCLTGAAQGAFTPWDALQGDLWVADPNDGSSRLNMNTVNNGSYAVGFDYAKKNGGARGMNSLKFSVGGSSSGRMSSFDLSGSFDVVCGGSKAYSDLLVLVAIEATALPGDFSMSIGLAGQSQYNFDNINDFCHYDPAALGYDAGRPSGYSSHTNPTSSSLAYDFNSGMVSIYAFSGLSFDSSSPVAIDYAFENLPGKAVFSLYALVNRADFIYHTNRGVADANDPSAAVSTFEVVPEPATISLLAVGVVAGLLRRRK